MHTWSQKRHTLNGARTFLGTKENKLFHTCIPIDDSFLLGIFSTLGSSLVRVPLSLFKVAFF